MAEKKEVKAVSANALHSAKGSDKMAEKKETKKPLAEKKAKAEKIEKPVKEKKSSSKKAETKEAPTKETPVEIKKEEKKQVPVKETTQERKIPSEARLRRYSHEDEYEEVSEEKEKKEVKKKFTFNFKLFDIWETAGIVVPDLSLNPYINVEPVLVPFTAGRNIKKQFWKSKKPIVERLILRMMVSGHKGKKHWRMSRWFPGKYHTIAKQVIETFKIVERKTKKNPLQVFVDSICNSAPREGITTIEYGGVRYPKAVDLSPQRRVDLVLRWMTQGAYQKKSSSKGSNPIAFYLAEEILGAYEKDSKSNTLSKKFELERQASASR